MRTLISTTKQAAGTFLVSAAALALLSGCAGTSEPPKTEEPTAVAMPPAPEPRTEGAISNPPSADEVRAKITYIFEDAVIFDASRRPGYLVGDFNGDGSQDLALIVRPVEAKLPDINNEVANWILGDPTQVLLPDPHKSVQTPPGSMPVLIERTDSHLLVLIHGHGPNGWRDPLARQTYLLKNAVGRNPTAQSVTELLKASKRNAKKPVIYAHMSKAGSVIMQSLRGLPGFLYYSGAKYVWYELKQSD